MVCYINIGHTTLLFLYLKIAYFSCQSLDLELPIPIGPNSAFSCDNGTSGMTSVYFCDGILHCTDSSDEIYLDPSEPDYNLTTGKIKCWNTENRWDGFCQLDQSVFCQQKIKCRGLTPCDGGCASHYQCLNSTCVERNSVCDENSCNGCLEDHGWTNGVGFRCSRVGVDCVLPQQLLWDAVSDCDGGVDRCYSVAAEYDGLPMDIRKFFGTTFNNTLCFECHNGDMIIPKGRLCDGIIHCNDLSDECFCENTNLDICNKMFNKFTATVSTNLSSQMGYVIHEHPLLPRGCDFTKLKKPTLNITLKQCQHGDIFCDEGNCVPPSAICDGKIDCLDQMDESLEYCAGTKSCEWGNTPGELCRCHTGYRYCSRRVAYSCNGESECNYPESENKLHYLTPKNVTFPEDECMGLCNSSFQCLCSPISAVGPGVGHISCTKEGNLVGSLDAIYACDGILHCPIGKEDETGCENRFTCRSKNLVNIPLEKKCDGFVDCDMMEDEYNAECKAERMYCSALGGRMVSIPWRQRCDFIIHCDAGEDETNCTDGRLYCDSGQPLFVSDTKILDGVIDCLDWSDECPKGQSTNPLSSRYELIGNSVLNAFVWIMGIPAVIGNMMVIYIEGKNCANFKRPSATKLANHMLVLNLAFADLLMGIYLVYLGSMAARYKGVYCTKDLFWRSSVGCKTLGVLSTISSQTSVMCLSSLTSCRLYAVMNPIDSSYLPRKRHVISLCILSWGIGFLLALVPLSSSLDYVFISSGYFPNNPFATSKIMNLSKARKFLQDFITYNSNPLVNVTATDITEVPSLSWNGMEQLSTKLQRPEYMKAEAYFGYYSSNGACISKFFVSSDDPSWVYSLFLTLFDFIAFSYVVTCYVFIYLQSSKHKDIQSTKTQKSLTGIQRKILRLIITDFICWIPICLMSFVTLAGGNLSNSTYAFAAIILLPINSALNPFLYSDLPDIIYSHAKKHLKPKKHVLHESSTTHDRSSNPVVSTHI